MTINKKLSNWKKESLFGERFFKKQETTLYEGEELYLISIKAEVTIEGKSKIIEKHKFFQTRVQGNDISEEINIQADDYICSKILSQLEAEFFNDYNEYFDQEAKKKISEL